MLKGTLDDFAITDVFRLLSTSHRTGRLEISRPAGSGHVLFSAGRVAYAETSLSTGLLGQKLIASGVLTEAQLRTAFDERAESGQGLGEILIANGVVEEKPLHVALSEQIYDAALELLQWEAGDFAWTPEAPVEVEIMAELEVDQLLSEVGRRQEEMERLRERIPSTGAVPALAKLPPQGADAITMSPQEWQTLVLVDGNRTVTEIAAAMGRPEFDTMCTLFSLVSSGLIELQGVERVAEATPAPTRAHEEPAPQPEPQPEPEHEPAIEPEPEFAVPVAGDAVPSDELADSTRSNGSEPGGSEDLAEVTQAGDPASDDWFSDPEEAVDPMSTEGSSSFELDDVTVTIEDVLDPAAEDDPEEVSTAGMAFPRSEAARELSGLMADESKRSKAGDKSSDEEDDNSKSIFSRLMGGKQ